jgi:hypothetical protein
MIEFELTTTSTSTNVCDVVNMAVPFELASGNLTVLRGLVVGLLLLVILIGGGPGS